MKSILNQAGESLDETDRNHGFECFPVFYPSCGILPVSEPFTLRQVAKSATLAPIHIFSISISYFLELS